MVCEMSMQEIKQICESSENGAKHWFKPDTMRFFSARVGETAYKVGDVAFFVSSEQFKSYYPTYRVEPRKYTVRKCNLKTGTIDDVGGFQAYDTRAQALAALKRAFKGEVQ